MIELLVVIAIIGILTSIVLVSMGGARDKAKDAAIQTGMSEIRAAAEMLYADQLDYNGICLEACGIAGTTTATTTGDIGRIRTSVMANNGNVDITCNMAANCTAYAVWTVLNNGSYWCVDSTGVSALKSVDIGDVTVCP